MVETFAVSPVDSDHAALCLFSEQLARTAELLRISPVVSHDAPNERLALLSTAAETLGFTTTMYGYDLLCVQAGSGTNVLTVVHHHDLLSEQGEGSTPARVAVPLHPPDSIRSACSSDFETALCGSLVTYHAAPALSLLYGLKAAVAVQGVRASSAAVRILFGADAESGHRCFFGAKRRHLFEHPGILVNGAFSGTAHTHPGWLDVDIRVPVVRADDEPLLNTPKSMGDQTFDLKWETAGGRSDLVPALAIVSLYPEALSEGRVLRQIETVIAAGDLPISVAPHPQRDRLGLRMVATGRSGHASDPRRADNALIHMAKLCSQLPVYGQRAFQWIAETFDESGQYRDGQHGDLAWSVGQLAVGHGHVDLRCATRLPWETDPTVILDDLRRRLGHGGLVRPKRLLGGRKDSVSGRLLHMIDAVLAADADSVVHQKPSGGRGPLTRFPDHVRGVSFGPVLTGQQDHAYEAGECVSEQDVLAATRRYAGLFANWFTEQASD